MNTSTLQHRSVRRLAVGLTALALPAMAHAHTGLGHTHGFLAGAAHPVLGVDHVCAMIAVGLWAAQRGGRALWAVPSTFVLVMALGGALGMAGVSLPWVEPGIVASVLILGLLIAASVRLPVVLSAGVVALFAVFHGYAHGAEAPATMSGFAYGAGFMAVTATLHLVGIALAAVMARTGRERVVRFAGGAIAACGVALCFV